MLLLQKIRTALLPPTNTTLRPASAPGGVFAADVTGDRVSVTVSYVEAREAAGAPVMHVWRIASNGSRAIASVRCASRPSDVQLEWLDASETLNVT